MIFELFLRSTNDKSSVRRMGNCGIDGGRWKEGVAGGTKCVTEVADDDWIRRAILLFWEGGGKISRVFCPAVSFLVWPCFAFLCLSP
jgi:hypothetical protein